MTKLNEHQIIKIFQKNIGKRKFVAEDVEVFNHGKTSCIINVDTLVESTDIPPRTKKEIAPVQLQNNRRPDRPYLDRFRARRHDERLLWNRFRYRHDDARRCSAKPRHRR